MTKSSLEKGHDFIFSPVSAIYVIFWYWLPLSLWVLSGKVSKTCGWPLGPGLFSCRGPVLSLSTAEPNTKFSPPGLEKLLPVFCYPNINYLFHCLLRRVKESWHFVQNLFSSLSPRLVPSNLCLDTLLSPVWFLAPTKLILEMTPTYLWPLSFHPP